MAHSRTNGVRTPDPLQNFDITLVKVCFKFRNGRDADCDITSMLACDLRLNVPL
ncbi:protein of unknown function [Methylorubrum extorquens DM4]|uniref:Uncharacterized protein n=1 Tax=Methylorubrum extorquens (strain DSM 6343 / CIP 106787 / DM4) TaxID=661410 RepID=C7C9A4_METED|nr:protein of unknown function [Methylorubrum extorquens DM4]